MKTSLVELLICPRCQASLSLRAYKSICAQEVIDGLLLCSCGDAYVIHDGVPCMVAASRLMPAFAESYRDRLRADAPRLLELDSKPVAADFSFSWQWNEHAYDDLTWELRLSQRVQLFYQYTGLTRESARGLLLLDAGCGNGTLSAALAGEGMNVVGLDLSEGAIRAFQYQMLHSRVSEEAAARLHYVQGDLARPPFGDGQFDLVYSDGVMHHTPDTRRTFLAVSTKVKPGGRLFVWLYRSDARAGHTLKMAVVKTVRVLTGWMPYSARMSLCYVAGFIILTGLRLLRLLGYRRRPLIPLRQKAINLFDTITPTFNHEHTPAETRGWFEEAGFTEIREVTIADFRLGQGGFAMMGTRGPCGPHRAPQAAPA